MFTFAAASSGNNRGSVRSAGFILALAAIATFIWAMGNGPIEDDIGLLNVRLAGVEHWSQIPSLFTESYWGDLNPAGLYRPLTLVTAAAMRLTFGNPLLAERILSLVLHASCTLLCRRLGNFFLASRGAFFAGLLFAVHPIHAEAVITVYGQSDLWATGFVLLACCLHLQWSREGRSAWWWLWIGVLYLLGLGFKESAILLPALLGILRGLMVGPSEQVTTRWIGLREGLVAAALVPYLAARFAVLHSEFLPPTSVVVGADAGMFSRLTIAAVALGTDLRLMVLPWGQTVYYGHLRDNLQAGGYIECAIVLLAVGIILFTLSPKRPWVGAGGALLVLGLLPVSGLIPIGVLVAERCLYLPSVGFVILAGGVLEACFSWRSRLVPMIAAVLITTVGIALSLRVCRQWSDVTTLWTTTLARHPRSPRAAATVMLLRLQTADKLSDVEVLECQRKLDDVERLNPELPELWLARAMLAEAQGDQASAKEYFQHAERLRPQIRKMLAPRAPSYH